MLIERQDNKVTFYPRVITGNEGDMSQRKKKRFSIERKDNKVIISQKHSVKLEMKLNQLQLQAYIQELQTIYDETYGTKLPPTTPNQTRIIKYM